MRANHANHTVLVPILGNDISDETYTKARSMLAQPDSRLVLLHICPANESMTPTRGAPAMTSEPRWHRLAGAIPADRTFIEAVAGDPTTEILAEADRFHTDTILF